MSDEDLSSSIRAALRERYPQPTDVDLEPRLQLAPRRGRHIRTAILAAASVLVITAVAGLVLVVRGANSPTAPSGDSRDADAASAYGLAGITWTDTDGGGVIEFHDHSIHISDGCDDGLHALNIGADWLQIGEPLGIGSVCGGVSIIPPSIKKFDRVMTGRLSWAKDGDTLRVTDASGEALEFHASGTPLAATDQQWALERVTDASGETITDQPGYSGPGALAAGSFDAGVLTIDGGTVHANDLCHTLTGSATVTDTQISFTNITGTDQPCTDPGLAATASVIDQVLSDTIIYLIRGDELILYGPGTRLLVYTAGN